VSSAPVHPSAEIRSIPDIRPYAMARAAGGVVNTAPWTPHRDRAVLLVHDMQHYFVGRLPGPEPAGPLVDNATRLRATAVTAGMPVGYTAQPGSMTAAQRGLLADFWGPGMRRTAADTAVVAPLTPRPGDWVLTKWRYSAFARTDLLERMRAAGRDQLVVCGVYAHVGILATAIEAFTHDIETFVAADAVADFSEGDHRLALDYIASRCGVVLATERIIEQLRRPSPAPVAEGMPT
jgi:isochorismate hydrolase